MRDGQIFPLGHQYRISCDSKEYRSLAFLSLHKEGREEFIVLLSFGRFFLALRSSEMKWKLVMGFKAPSSENIVTFRGMFYVTIRASMTTIYNRSFLVAPNSRVAPESCGLANISVSCGNDEELFMVKKSSLILMYQILVGSHAEQQGNVSCSAKELPDGCGVSENSILFTNELDNGTYVYKYGVDTGREEDDLNCWRFSGENRVTILSTSPVVNFRVEY
ncbi:hypothetical protein F2Q70_00027805 [Brassica cretica]|nr:hypothetical protein F2Q70_00027805 [Brassica cretica]